MLIILIVISLPFLVPFQNSNQLLLLLKFQEYLENWSREKNRKVRVSLENQVENLELFAFENSLEEL